MAAGGALNNNFTEVQSGVNDFIPGYDSMS